MHRLVGSAFLSNGYMGGLASRRAGGSRSIKQSFSMICRCENMTTNGLQGVRRGCAESDEGARSKFRAGQMVETEMDRDEVPVNCEQAHKGIWGQAKQDEGGLEASDSISYHISKMHFIHACMLCRASTRQIALDR